MKRDLAKELEDYAAHPIKGSMFVPVHRDTLREAAELIRRLSQVTPEMVSKARSSYFNHPEYFADSHGAMRAALTAALGARRGE